MLYFSKQNVLFFRNSFMFFCFLKTPEQLVVYKQITARKEQFFFEIFLKNLQSCSYETGACL